MCIFIQHKIGFSRCFRKNSSLSSCAIPRSVWISSHGMVVWPPGSCSLRQTSPSIIGGAVSTLRIDTVGSQHRRTRILMRHKSIGVPRGEVTGEAFNPNASSDCFSKLCVCTKMLSRLCPQPIKLFTFYA